MVRTGQDPFGNPSKVEDRILPCRTPRDEPAGLMGRGDLVRHEDDSAPARRPVKAMDANPAVLDGGDAKPAIQRGRQVVAVSLERHGQLEHALRRHSKAAKSRAQDDAGDDCRRAAAEAAADRHPVLYTKLDAIERTAPSGKRFLRRAHNQVPPVERKLAHALAVPLDGGLRRLARLDLEVEIERKRENVKAPSEVGRRCRHRDRGGFRHYSLNASCNVSTAQRVAGLESGADVYLAKPFAPSELVARVRSVLRRTRSAQTSTIRYGDIVVDPARRLAKLDDQTLELTTSEFDLLHALVHARGRVLTRAFLIDAVIRSEADGIQDRSIDVYVRRLRSKLGDSARDPGHVVTVRGIGYRLAGP